MTVKFHGQHTRRWPRIQFQQISRGLKFPLSARLIQQHAIKKFDSGRFQIFQLHRGLHRLRHRIEKDQA